MILTNSVGRNGVNRVQDVKYVQQLLNDWLKRAGQPGIGIDGIVGNETIRAIEKFQRVVVGLAQPDGLAEPGRRTIQGLQELHMGALLGGLHPDAVPHAQAMVTRLSAIELEMTEEAAQLRLDLEFFQSALETSVRDYLQALHDS